MCIKTTSTTLLYIAMLTSLSLRPTVLSSYSLKAPLPGCQGLCYNHYSISLLISCLHVDQSIQKLPDYKDPCFFFSILYFLMSPSTQRRLASPWHASIITVLLTRDEGHNTSITAASKDAQHRKWTETDMVRPNPACSLHGACLVNFHYNHGE